MVPTAMLNCCRDHFFHNLCQIIMFFSFHSGIISQNLHQTNPEKALQIQRFLNPLSNDLLFGVSPLANSAKIYTRPRAGQREKRCQRFDPPFPVVHLL